MRDAALRHVISKEGFLRIVEEMWHRMCCCRASEVSLKSSLSFSGTSNDATYREYCEDRSLEVHPARMQAGLAAFFIQFLTEPNDMVLDPSAGSNTTGAIAEALGEIGLLSKLTPTTPAGSKGRFPEKK